MRDRIDEPRYVKSHDGAQENAPQYEAKSADRVQRDSEDKRWQKMVLREPDVKLVLGEIGDIALEG